jgi:hypothetical protein
MDYHGYIMYFSGVSRVSSRIGLTTKRSSPPEGAKGNFSNVISRKSGESWKFDNVFTTKRSSPPEGAKGNHTKLHEYFLAPAYLLYLSYFMSRRNIP